MKIKEELIRERAKVAVVDAPDTKGLPRGQLETL